MPRRGTDPMWAHPIWTRPVWTKLGALLLALQCLGTTCGPSALAVIPVNSAGNRTLRRELFAMALSQLCPEVQKRSVSLKLRDADPGTGRFFPTACNVQEMENGNLFITINGHGYAWTNVTGRMGFEAALAVEYNHDFLMDGSTMYIYFRQKSTQTSKFTVQMIERSRDAKVSGIASLLGTSVSVVSDRVGDRILLHQLARGFTVVRESDGTVGFSLGVLERGDMPDAPFARGDSDWMILANERIELHQGQRDFAGPFTVEDGDDETLWLTATVEGAPTVDVLVVPKAIGDTWLQGYEHEPQPTQPPGSALLDLVLEAPANLPGQPPKVLRQALRLPKGSYYVVFDHSGAAGQTQPPAVPYDDRAALVSYAVQLGEPP